MAVVFPPIRKGITVQLFKKPPKPKLKVTDAKRLARGMQKIGQTVTGVEVRPDGSILVLVADPATASKPNPWDKVLT
jgi:glucose/arabinose dehydrogenase